MNNVLLYIGGVLVAVLSALFAVPHFIDWNGYRGVFEEEVSRFVGREVRVGGAVNVRLLPSPYVRFEKIRVADATGGTGEPFFRADAFTLWLSVPPLLRGVLEANEVELKRPRLNLRADASGRGNWSTLGLSAGALPLVPAGVSLQAVRIIDGSIAIAAGGAEMQLAGLEGELEAEALDGPFKFKGDMVWRGEQRQVRIATAKSDADGGLRLKTAVTAPRSGNSYVVDGRLSDLGGSPRFDGEIQGKIGLAGTAVASAVAGAPNAAEPKSDAKDRSSRPYIDLKAAISADLTAARLAQIVLSVENVGQPQLVTGDARADWRASPAVELALSSRWLDLDRLAGRDPDDQPIETAQALVAELLGELPETGRVDARFEVEQTTLGGEAVSGLTLKLQRDTGALAIRELRAGLPGGARLDITGKLVEGAAGPELDGALVVRGSSLLRFLTWAGRNRSLIEGRSDGPFLVRGRLRLGETLLALTEGAAELNGVPIEGDIRYEARERRKLTLRLDGQSVDLAQLWPAALERIGALLAPAAASPAAKPETPSPARDDLSTMDLDLWVRVAELAAGPRVLRDVDANLSLEKGRLSIPRLRLTTTDGLELDLEGEIADATSRPKGTLRGLIAADRPAAVESLVKALADGAAIDGSAAGISALVPLRLAGRVTLGGRLPAALDIDADGHLQGGRFVAAARLDGGWRGWREANADVTISADSPDTDQLVRFLLAAGQDTTARGRTVRRGQVNLKAYGVPSQALLAAASVTAPGMVLSYDGPLRFEKSAASALDGELRISADSAADALELAGVPLGGAVAGVPLDGLFHITARDNVLTVKPRDVLVGGQRIGGQLIVAQRTGDRPSTVTARLELGDVRLADLLTPALERRSQAEAMTAAALGGDAPVAWPETGFDLSATDRIDGQVDIRFNRLVLDNALELGPGRLVARLAPGRIDVETLDGPVLGGTFGASVSLMRAKGGVDGKVSIKMTALKPRLPAAAKDAAATPGVTVSLDLEGRGTSPRTLVGALKGRGSAELADVQIAGLTPASVRSQAEAFVSGRIEPGDGALSRALEDAAAAATVQIPPGRYAIEAADGLLRVKQVTIATNEGRTNVDTSLDLGELRLDSEWRIEVTPTAALVGASAAGGRGSPLPPVFAIYAGPLGAITAIGPRVSAGALERELAVRKMERDVDELERLRKEDERRRAEDSERLRRIEAERAAATPAAPNGAALDMPVPSPSAVPSGTAQPGAGAAAPQATEKAPIRVAPAAPRPVRRVSPADEIMRQLSPN